MTVWIYVDTSKDVGARVARHFEQGGPSDDKSPGPLRVQAGFSPRIILTFDFGHT
jgi:hypothetical protein